MKNASPLRYPGGKSSMAGLLCDLRRINDLGDRAVAEPFAGGAGAALSLLYREEAPRIYINDADPAIYSFWWAVTTRIRAFLQTLSTTRVTISEWKRQRRIYRSTISSPSLRRGFAAFYLNRCNRSGIVMNGGPIGGIDQSGTWKLNARYNKRELGERCAKVAEYRQRIVVSCTDGIEFISKTPCETTLFFIDPPYYSKGPTLYLNALDAAYHKALAEQLNAISDRAWVLTYDDCPQVRKLYRGWASIRPFKLRYAAAERRQGKELLITPRWLRLPLRQESAAISW